MPNKLKVAPHYPG